MGQNPVPEITDIHQALQRAALSEGDRVPLENANFKCNPVKKEIAIQICEKNGTTFSAYMRECVNALVADYMGPVATAELDGAKA